MGTKARFGSSSSIIASSTVEVVKVDEKVVLEANAIIDKVFTTEMDVSQNSKPSSEIESKNVTYNCKKVGVPWNDDSLDDVLNKPALIGTHGKPIYNLFDGEECHQHLKTAFEQVQKAIKYMSTVQMEGSSLLQTFVLYESDKKKDIEIFEEKPDTIRGMLDTQYNPPLIKLQMLKKSN